MALIAILLTVLVSCSLIPEEIVDNVTHPKIEYSSSFKMPVLATSLILDDIVEKTISQILEGKLDYELVGSSPVILKASTDLLNLKVSSPLDILRNSSETIETEELSIPELEDLEFEITPPLPDIKDSTLSVFIDLLPSGESSISTETKIYMGIDDSDLKSFETVGYIGFRVTLPENWNDVKVLSIEAEAFDGEGNSISKGTISGDYGRIDITNKVIKVGNGELKLDVTVKLSNNGVPRDGTVTVLIFSNFDVYKLNGMKIGFEGSLPLANHIKKITFKGGKLILSSTELEFLSVDSSLMSEDSISKVSVVNGDLMVNLEGFSLPATFVLNEITATVEVRNPDEIHLSGNFEGVEASDVLVHAPWLKVTGDYTTDFSSHDIVLRKIHLSNGKLSVEYSSSYPVPIVIHLFSDQVIPNLDKVLILNPSNHEQLVDLSNSDLELVDNSFTIHYEAYPSGYDDGDLLIENIDFGSTYTFDSTMSLKDVDVPWLIVGNADFSREKSLKTKNDDLKGWFRLFSYSNIITKLVATDPITGTFLFKADVKRGDKTDKYEIESYLEGVENELPKFTDFLKDVMWDLPDEIEYSMNVHIDEVKVRPDGFDMGFNLEMPLMASVPSSVLVMRFSTNLSLDLGGFSEILKKAVLIIDGGNTSMFQPKVEIIIANKRSESFYISKNIAAVITLNGDELGMLEREGLPLEVRVYAVGDQLLNSGGRIDLKIRMNVEVTYSTGGGG